MTTAGNTEQRKEEDRRTRQQKLLDLAVEHVNAVAAAHGGDDKLKKAYGSLCHKFPVLVRSCGLCQAVAFVEAKASSSGYRGTAHALLRDHAFAVLSMEGRLGPKGTNLLEAVRATKAAYDYALMTRTLLDAFVYYKRFAESILDVKAGDDQSLEGSE